MLDLILMAGAARAFTADAAADALASAAHGLSDGAGVILRTSAGYFLPKPLEPETVYYVRDKTADALKLAATQGGPAVNITWPGSGVMTLTPVTVVKFAAAEVEVGDDLYTAHLHPTKGLKLTKTASLDRFAVEVQNADKVMGVAITGVENALENALAVVGTVHADLDSGDAYRDPRLPGLVVGAKVDEASSAVSFTVVSDVDEAEYAGDLLAAFFPASDPPAAGDHGVIDDLVPPNPGRSFPDDPRDGRWRFPPMISPEAL